MSDRWLEDRHTVTALVLLPPKADCSACWDDDHACWADLDEDHVCEVWAVETGRSM